MANDSGCAEHPGVAPLAPVECTRMPSVPKRRHSPSNALLIGGDTSGRERLQRLLVSAGLTHVTLDSAADARATLRRAFFPIVLIYENLHDADGIELCHEVRRHDSESRVYILILSELDSDDDIAKGLAAGADDCLCARSSDAELLEQLRRASLHTLSTP